MKPTALNITSNNEYLSRKYPNPIRRMICPLSNEN